MHRILPANPIRAKITSIIRVTFVNRYGKADTCYLRCFQACSIVGLSTCFHIRYRAIFAFPTFNEMGSTAELGPIVPICSVTSRMETNSKNSRCLNAVRCALILLHHGRCMQRGTCRLARDPGQLYKALTFSFGGRSNKNLANRSSSLCR